MFVFSPLQRLSREKVKVILSVRRTSFVVRSNGFTVREVHRTDLDTTRFYGWGLNSSLMLSCLRCERYGVRLEIESTSFRKSVPSGETFLVVWGQGTTVLSSLLSGIFHHFSESFPLLLEVHTEYGFEDLTRGQDFAKVPKFQTG